MNKPITYVAILIAVVIAFFSFQKFSQRNITSEKSTLIQAEPEVTVKKPSDIAKIDPVRDIKTVLINPNSGIGPSIVKGSKVKLAYQIKNAKTGAFIDETGKNNLPTDFEIGKPNIFGELLTTLVGANKGAKLQLTLPPEFGVQNPAAREFAKAHNLASDTILSIEFTVVDIVPAR